MAAPTYREIMTSIQKRQFKPVYLLMGEESYFIDNIVAALEKAVVSEADRDFNVNTYYGADADIDTVVGCAQQFPVMSDYKLVLLKEAQGMQDAKINLEKMAPYAHRPNPSTVLVITFKKEALTASSDLVKAVNKNGGVVFKSAVPRDYELPVHLKDYCQGRRIGIDDKAVGMLCEYIGGPLSKLFGEVNKLIQIKGGSGRITPDDVERNIGISKEYNNFELTKALGSRNYPKCMAIIKHFASNPKGNPSVVTTAILFNFFTRLVIAHFLPEKSDSAIMQALDLKNTYALRDTREALRNYSPAQAVNAIHYLREFDAKSKGVKSFGQDSDLMAELIFKIMT